MLHPFKTQRVIESIFSCVVTQQTQLISLEAAVGGAEEREFRGEMCMLVHPEGGLPPPVAVVRP